MKRVIIVGATSGIGRALAVLYAQADHQVGITGRRGQLLEEIQQAYPTNIITRCFDVTGPENRSHIQMLINTMGGLDLLIYNAGFGDPSRELIEEIEIATTRTNVNGFVDITSFAFNYFAAQGYGQLAVTASIAALRGNSWAPAYSASKAFLSNYAESLNLKAKRLRKNIVVTDIKPGFINTKLAKGERQFWVAPVDKAAKQIFCAIQKKQRVAYITKRWWIIAQILKIIPFWLYRRIV